MPAYRDSVNQMFHCYLFAEKLIILKEKPNIDNIEIVSPNFPLGYATDSEIFSYNIVTRNNSGYVRVTFDDWDLASHSKLVVSIYRMVMYYLEMYACCIKLLNVVVEVGVNVVVTAAEVVVVVVVVPVVLVVVVVVVVIVGGIIG